MRTGLLLMFAGLMLVGLTGCRTFVKHRVKIEGTYSYPAGFGYGLVGVDPVLVETGVVVRNEGRRTGMCRWLGYQQHIVITGPVMLVPMERYQKFLEYQVAEEAHRGPVAEPVSD
ncbi:MAG: hypothetical protein FWD53_10605 [Phycisphaerales bacterium]|nr:hypothetical protein [Phycisphaerales bacterium]